MHLGQAYNGEPLYFWKGSVKFLKKLFARTKCPNKLFAHLYEKRKKLFCKLTKLLLAGQKM
jgi:hypothetical protein